MYTKDLKKMVFARLSETDYKCFELYCANCGLPMSVVLRKIIKSYIVNIGVEQ